MNRFVRACNVARARTALDEFIHLLLGKAHIDEQGAVKEGMFVAWQTHN